MKKDITLPTAVGVAVLLELLPDSITVNRIAAPGEQFIDHYSYFDMTSFWSENRYPLITGILTVLLFVFILSGTRVKKPMLDICTAVVNILAFIYAVRTAYDQYENTPVLYIVPVLLIMTFGLFLLKKAASG